MSQHLDPISWTATLAAARAGSRDALGRLLQYYWRYLVCIAQRKRPDALMARLGADDLVQQVMHKAIRSFHSFRGETPEEWRDWLRSILCNKVQDAIRRATRRRRSITCEVPGNGNGSGPDLLEELSAAAQTPEELLVRQEEVAALGQAVAELPALQQEVIWLRFVEGLPHIEIARRHGRSVNAVQLLYQRTVDRMRRRLDRCG
jgi:RNA polymerase sigma-70 factor (ECF subfamily)